MARHTSVTWRLLSIAWASLAIGIASPALAQSAKVTQAGAPVEKPPAGTTGVRLGAPPGSYIAERAKNARFDDDRTATYQHNGKKISFTPARVTGSLEEAAQGHVLGILETEVEGSETGLPPGRYTIFAKSVGGEWEAFAEVDGKVIQQSIEVRAVDVQDDKSSKPTLEASDEAWCWTTGPYPAPTAWARYDHRGYWHYYPTAWGGHQKLTVCW
jgi:hypothetical protein